MKYKCNRRYIYYPVAVYNDFMAICGKLGGIILVQEDTLIGSLDKFLPVTAMFHQF
jgi:hypothetical protein